jgi:hypothetical protein
MSGETAGPFAISREKGAGIYPAPGKTREAKLFTKMFTV